MLKRQITRSLFLHILRSSIYMLSSRMPLTGNTYQYFITLSLHLPTYGTLSPFSSSYHLLGPLALLPLPLGPLLHPLPLPSLS